MAEEQSKLTKAGEALKGMKGDFKVMKDDIVETIKQNKEKVVAGALTIGILAGSVVGHHVAVSNSEEAREMRQSNAIVKSSDRVTNPPPIRPSSERPPSFETILPDKGESSITEMPGQVIIEMPDQDPFTITMQGPLIGNDCGNSVEESVDTKPNPNPEIEMVR